MADITVSMPDGTKITCNKQKWQDNGDSEVTPELCVLSIEITSFCLEFGNSSQITGKCEDLVLCSLPCLNDPTTAFCSDIDTPISHHPMLFS